MGRGRSHSLAVSGARAVYGWGRNQARQVSEAPLAVATRLAGGPRSGT
jgi:hypothetical protein